MRRPAQTDAPWLVTARSRPRVNQLLRRLRQAPISAPSADPPGELTYGEALTALKFAALPDPSLWPLAAAALVCADSPARHPARRRLAAGG